MKSKKIIEFINFEYGILVEEFCGGLGGYSAENLLLVTQDGRRLVLKSSRDCQQVFDAMEVSSLLGQESTLIPMPIPAKNGALAVRRDDRAYALLPYIDAAKHHGPSLSEPKLWATAHVLAEFHEYAEVAEHLARPCLALSFSTSSFFAMRRRYVRRCYLLHIRTQKSFCLH